MATPWESKLGLLTLGAVKLAEDSSKPRVAVESAAAAAAGGAKTAPVAEAAEAAAGRGKPAGEGAAASCRPGAYSSDSNAAVATPPFLATSSAFLERVTGKFSSYAMACRGVSNLGDWMAINSQYFGSSLLYTDELSTGLLFGYCAGYAFNRALRFGALLCGIGFISLQTLHHFGYIQVNWKRVEEDIKRPLDFNGDGKVDQEDVAAIQRKLLQFMARGVPSTAGLSLGLLWGLRAGR